MLISSGAVIFVWGWIHQYRCHSILASLRANDKMKKEDSQYKIPYGDWFEYVSCAHYLAEFVIYIGFLVATGGSNLDTWLLFVFVVLNLSIAAGDSHKWAGWGQTEIKSKSESRCSTMTACWLRGFPQPGGVLVVLHPFDVSVDGRGNTQMAMEGFHVHYEGSRPHQGTPLFSTPFQPVHQQVNTDMAAPATAAINTKTSTFSATNATNTATATPAATAVTKATSVPPSITISPHTSITAYFTFFLKHALLTLPAHIGLQMEAVGTVEGCKACLARGDTDGEATQSAGELRAECNEERERWMQSWALGREQGLSHKEEGRKLQR
ncbi:hypothetical protein GOP47_0015739 [Adiantum capillus-veneris]|uniref:3-oxo-5-alpha-steroid 4-dehydrogenase C-terminal domain-containing protein n=1 Tax=Adiantum capillus-veneris TaxID=13818 RepID=A0A9D4ULD6_ADICA|nr:hypothetical protein GOP47_0015739 [Adiantum capillus-veneris]